MKKIYLALLLSLNLFAIALAKSPQTISYQAIVRGANGNIIQESNIGIKISILQNGDEVYSEERIEQSNKNGLLSFAIGDENGTSNQSIESIDWSKGNYTIRCEMDLQGGDNYSLSMTTPLTSVPYALYAETVSPDVLPKKVSELVNDKNFVSIEQLNTILNDRVNSKDNGAESEESPTITPLSIQLTSRDTAKWNAKLDNFTEQDPLFSNSVAAKISAKDTAKWNAKLDDFTEQDPLFNNSVAAKISAKDTAKWNAKLDNFTEQDPLFNNSVAAKISAKDTAKWNAKLDNFTEQDPLFSNSVAAKISAKDTAKWNAKLDNFTEQDPLFSNSVAAKISAKDTAKWNAKLDDFTEQDPLFNNSVAAKISAKDTAKWNAKLDNFTEQDPLFYNSVAAKISAKDTAKWNAKLDDFTEQDPLFYNSVAAKISAKDTAKWNAKLDDFTEQDPLFNNSVAAKITKEDTNNWNAKLSEEKDPIYTKSPAASIKEQNIQQWNAKVDSTTYMNSAAAKITQNDVANWNAKLDASKLPANVSAFNNDAEYVKKQILNDSIKAISNRLGSTISTLQENNKQLSAKIKKLEEDYSELFETVNKIGNLTDKIAQSALAYRRAETTSYPLKFNNWNNTPDAYNALQDGDRIIFIIRHSIRSEESAFDSKLTKEGINLAKEVGAKLRGGKATANDAYYGSTNYPRCMQTSFYIAQSRGDSNWKDSSMVVNPISEILQTYYSSSTDWDYFAKLYEQSPEVTNDLSVKMINRLCQLSEGKTFAWFTTHDFVAVPLCSWASYGAINFKRPNWINFLTGVAVIVHPDNSWEVYPVKCNDSPYSSVSWYK